VFDLKRLGGIKVPGRKGQSRREFTFYMETDGVGCSFVCCRPRAAAQDPVTPENARIVPGETTVKAADPGQSALVTLELGCDGDVQER
jgi:hypothetical protein